MAMAKAAAPKVTLTLDPNNWDQIQLVLHGDIPRILSLRNRSSAIELNRLLTIAYHSDHEGDLALEIDGTEYIFPQTTWHAILSVVDQWLEKFLPAEHPEYFDS